MPLKPQLRKVVLSCAIHRGLTNRTLMAAFYPRTILSIAMVAFACVLLAGAPALAQAPKGELSGVVRAKSGAPVVDVHIRLRLSDGAVTAVTTDPTGQYRFSNLPPGRYGIAVSAPGFMSQVLAVTVSADRKNVLNIFLTAGNPGQVSATATPAARSQDAGAGGDNVNRSTVVNTPLNGRDWTQLASLQAGVTGVQAGNANGTGNADRGFGAAVSISGARPDQNSYRLDGISINDYSNGAPGSVLGDNLGVDAVEQVSVLGNNYPAEYGRTTGGVINAVTRSGTNGFHGSVYAFLRNSAVDARNFFDARIPPFKRNQFGGSLGGPLRKDRTFVFADYEGLRQSLGITHVNTVPSAAARAGVLSTGSVR